MMKYLKFRNTLREHSDKREEQVRFGEGDLSGLLLTIEDQKQLKVLNFSKLIMTKFISKNKLFVKNSEIKGTSLLK